MGKGREAMKTFSILIFAALIFAAEYAFAADNAKATDDSVKKKVNLEFRLVCEEPSNRTIDVTDRKTGKKMYVLNKVALSIKDIRTVQVVPDLYMEPEVAIFLTEEGKRKLIRITQNNIGRRMAILFNGEIIVAPTIRRRIASGQFVIAGDFEEGEIDDLIDAFNKGDGVMMGNGGIHSYQPFAVEHVQPRL